ncbi:testis-specific gene 13 protein isoform X2 [Antechinus flavipes]|uniref:testis-specific gene 13 protein isoform X2 n=1 Tax=Antechinus flavipes TaxID=38775 RepID=UPI0022359ABD|nr:testis-specific gene 13 protein isoform X2 [Antechinus flavipes]
MEGKYDWQKANIKKHGPRFTTWKKSPAAKSVQKTGAAAGLESRKMDTRSGRRKANIKMRAPTTWKKPRPKEDTKEVEASPGLGDLREIPKKTDIRSGRQKAHIKSRGTRTRKKPKAKAIAKEKEIPLVLEDITEVPKKMEGKEEWQKATIKVHLLRTANWRRKSTDSGQETETFSDVETGDEITEPEGRKGWRRASLKLHAAMSKTWKKTKSPDSAHETESASDLETDSEVPEKKKHKKRWGRADVKIRAIRAAKLGAKPSILEGVDDKKSKFVLVNLEHYAIHPNLEQQKAINRAGLPLMKKKKKLKHESRTPFPVVVLEDAKPKREQWYRFSTKADFKGEAKFSKLHALRKQQETYPNLSFVPDCRSVAAARAQAARRKVSIVTWEPLTLATLLEEKPTLTVPLPGKSPFRYGRAPQWFTNAPTVSN